MLTGGCSCGAVRYELDAAPSSSTLCHCVDCRRIVGAPAVAWLTVPATALRFVHGSPQAHRSSAWAVRGFCGVCGTHLTYRHDGYPEEVDIVTCSLDDPAAVPPRDHTFAAQRLPWMRVDDMRVGDGLPVYPRSRGEGLQKE
jgi:hypothetical protein